jgi:serine/threonine protein kinase
VPNPFYRASKAPVPGLDAATFSFQNKEDMGRLQKLMGSITASGALERDAAACVAFLDSQKQVNTATKIGPDRHVGYWRRRRANRAPAAVLSGRCPAGECDYRAGQLGTSQHPAWRVLPDVFAHDADRLARFEREAKTLALLNHANIAIVHGLERLDDGRALVMEHVDGPTLAGLPQGRSLSTKPSRSPNRLRPHWKPRTSKASSIAI